MLRLLLLLCFPSAVFMVKSEDFKTCSQSSFCARQRAFAEYAKVKPEYKDTFQVVGETVESSKLRLDILNVREKVEFYCDLEFLQVGSIRLRINEKSPLKPRYQGASDFIVQNLKNIKVSAEIKENAIDLEFNGYSVNIQKKPFTLNVSKGSEPVFAFNHRGFFHFEHLRPKQDAIESTETDESIKEIQKRLSQDMWNEYFGGKPDSKPNGPTSIGIDFKFAGFEHAFGIPEHGSSFSLKATKGTDAKYSEPFRLYNLDVFEYILDSPMALYGSIPYVTAHRPGQTVGLLWVNAAEQWVDVEKDDSVHFHWSAESGIVDIFLLLGDNPQQVQTQLASISGMPTMPQQFAVAYHQCRWNYNDEKDVLQVDAGFDKHQIPYDVLWLDIEHTDGKRYFTWDSSKFPNPEKMQNLLFEKRRRMVTIIDPHIKKDSGYPVSENAKKKDLFVKDCNGNEYNGWCWPGDSNWLDFTNPAARDYWADLFTQYQGSTPSLYTWNDMNEPSVFTGPEITMHKDNLHFGGWEHRDVHNLYGMLQQQSTFAGHLKRSNNNDRPFVLSRAFFIGTQRYGPIWTGDNFAKWDHLLASVPMLLSCGIAGMPFVGADVGGFFGNPDPELLVRWYQVGVFQPFFRAHAHIETKRREPWLFGQENTDLIRDAVIQRYRNLAYIYTLNFESHLTGAPVMRPMYYEFPQDVTVLGIDDQFMLGSAILVKPVSEPGSVQMKVYLPPSSLWYNYYTLKQSSTSGTVNIKTPKDRIGVFFRGGSIVPRKERIRRSSELMKNDPFTLLVALDSKGEAFGKLYVDDGKSYNYFKGEYLLTEFVFANNTLKATPKQIENWSHSLNGNSLATRVERLVVVGLKTRVANVEVNGKKLLFTTEENGQGFNVIVKDPATLIGSEWSILFQ